MSARLDRIAALHGPRLVSKLLDSLSGNAPAGSSFRKPDAVVRYFAEHDPTPNHRYTQWLVITFIRGGFLLEDLSKAKETLELWHEHAHRLPMGKRDIATYETLASVWKTISPLAKLVSGHAEDRAERDAARAESLILHEGDDGFIVAVPLTERASNWWGRGTRWCTAATRGPNYFSAYNAAAPLVVAIMPNGDKFQMTVGGQHGFQMMDASDDTVGADTVAERWNEFAPLVRWSLTKSFSPMRLVPDGGIDVHEVRASLLAHPPHHMEGVGQNIPDEVWPTLSDDDLLQIMHKHNNVIDHIPERQLTAKVIRGSVLKDHPPRRIPEWWLETEPDAAELVCRHSPSNVTRMPPRYLTMEMMELLCDVAPEQMERVYAETLQHEEVDSNKLRILCASKGINIYFLDAPHSPERIEEATIAGFKAGLWSPLMSGQKVSLVTARSRFEAAIQSPSRRGRAWTVAVGHDTFDDIIPAAVLTQDIVDGCCLHCYPLARLVPERWLSPVVRAVLVQSWLDGPAAEFSPESLSIVASRMDTDGAGRHTISEHVDILSRLEDDELDRIVGLVPRTVFVLPRDRRTSVRLGFLADNGSDDPDEDVILGNNEGMLRRLDVSRITWNQSRMNFVDGRDGSEAAYIIDVNISRHPHCVRSLPYLPPEMWSPQLVRGLHRAGYGAFLPEWTEQKWPDIAAHFAARMAEDAEGPPPRWNESFLDGLRVLLDERAAHLTTDASCRPAA